MYTQCPECEVAFRVTAEVLKQAAGKVRCGGCGVAFNSLAHLSEDMPVKKARGAPGLDPAQDKADEPGELEAAAPPKAISAEQSATLLKTLDQLAGEDIRIEDTGVEWRVIGNEEDENDADTDDDPTDEPLSSGAHEEMRFDDNTPLPDDFDLDASGPVRPAPVASPEETSSAIEESHVDLAFGESGEWEDLLDDLEETASAIVVEETKVHAADLDPSDEVPVVRGGADEEVADASGAEEALKPHTVLEFAGDESFEPESEPTPADEVWDAEEPWETGQADDGPGQSDAAGAAEKVPDVDTQFALLGLDLSGRHVQVDDEDGLAAADDHAEAVPEAETTIDDDLIAAAFEAEAREDRSADPGDEAMNLAEERSEEVWYAADDADADEFDEFDANDKVDRSESADELSGNIEFEAEPADGEELEAELQQALEDLTGEDDESEPFGHIDLSDAEQPDESPAPEILEVPELSEEEKTINMMIDQDLLAIAVEDDDGFASTIVQNQISDADDIPREKISHSVSEDDVSPAEDEDEEPSDDATGDNPLMETIIMEGDFVHSEEELARREIHRKEASENLKKIEAETTISKVRDWRPPRSGMLAAAVILFVILIVQAIHHSREVLAISPVFQATIAPVYRVFGNPVTPAWDVKGWRFEATKGSTDETGQVLTIYSRVGNTTEQSLPYPLVHVSLTDRFEEIIGSRVLEPAEYLVENTDTAARVRPGETFNAVIAIQSPASDATGFKLDVCYRLAGGQLRCALEIFK